jgi:hypothetical protein
VAQFVGSKRSEEDRLRMSCRLDQMRGSLRRCQKPRKGGRLFGHTECGRAAVPNYERTATDYLDGTHEHASRETIDVEFVFGGEPCR